MTKITLEKIAGFIGSGFTVPKKETIVGTIEPTSKEAVVVERGHGAYISESGGDVSATPDVYSGCREYYSPSGKPIFSEILPLEGVYEYRPGCCSCSRFAFSHYVISKSARPAVKRLETVSTKISGKSFWKSWSFMLTQIVIPSEIKSQVLGISESHIRKGKIPFALEIK